MPFIAPPSSRRARCPSSRRASSVSHDQRRLPAPDQDLIDPVDVKRSVDDGCHEHNVAGQQPAERRHSVQDQGSLCLVQIELRRKADTEDDVSPDRVLFLGNELVPVVFRNVGGKEDVLLQHAFFFESGSHVVREWPRPGQHILHVFPEKDRQLLQPDRLDLFIQALSRFPICFVQLLHPFIVEHRRAVARRCSMKGAVISANDTLSVPNC